MKKMREITFSQAQNEAFDEEMARDDSVFIIGEDIGEHWGGPMGQFRGLFAKYGAERIRETPISETAILGAAIGAAATGMRSIAAMMFVDFLGVAGDELLNQLQMRYMYGGKVKLPLTILAGIGTGVSAAAQHSKSMFGWLAAIQGLKIVVPSTPYDAKGLLKSAIREDNPVVFLTHKRLGGRLTSQIEDEDFTVPLGKADIKREGSDVTVVATAYMVHRALAAAATLQEEGISLEVIDPRTLVPLDKQAIYDSVGKTGRLVIISEEPRTGSWAGEVAALVAEEAFDSLDAPVKRVCAPDTPIPFSPAQERFWTPDEQDLIKAVREIT
ncbi:MAG: alpha-ketoacid dehydrogenase subunit beta [Dehalococcoidales bacterium]